MRNVLAASLLVAALAACAPASEANEPAAQATSPTSAQQEQELEGTYELTADSSLRMVDGVATEGGEHTDFDSEWEITACRPGCADVTSSAGWGARMWLDDGQWTTERQVRVDCDETPDGELFIMSTMTYSFDAVTLAGTFTESVPCPQNSRVVQAPVTLTRA